MKSATLHGGTSCTEYSNYIKIEYSLVNGRGLTDLDKIVASLIHFYSKRPEGCTASNEHLAFVLEKTPKAISDSISRLTKKGIVSRTVYKTKNGSRRTLKSLLIPNWAWNTPKKETQTITATPDFENSTPEITDSLPQNTDCMQSANSGSKIIVQNDNQIKEKENNSSFEVLKKETVIKKVKTLIEEEFGEYDANKEKEESSIDKWKTQLKDKHPEEITEIILKHISQLIQIRKSEKFGYKEFWLSVPVNISSSFSYRLQIKNTALTLLPKEEIKTKIESLNNNENSSMGSELKEPTWEGFKIWYSKRLPRTSIETLNKLKYTLEDSKLSILDELSDSLKRIVRKYFNEEITTPITVFFSESEGEEKSKENPEFPIVEPELGGRNEFKIKESTQKISKSIFQPEKQKESNFKHFRDYMSVDKVIHEFMSHSTLTLDRKDLEIIRNLKIRYDLEKIVIFDSPPERLKNHIRDYFYSLPQRVIALQFEENKFYVAA
ncbi:hypothetical protein [Leptospira noguchii]|uniref:hypothetical protein n=1 Tax=Leptospira noguchii TaxID=28182 RepID=UPI001FB81D85|nr:hypothetical protein [Leptospira noguchii]UOG55093.1 hypothetical protein MAL09_22070 [Leptospira noguchii]